ncbi:MAG: hypothetical protein A2289_16840 [Deltaproteobacteria bacterium RIFOXYA12_FULL_58_15]|nr:MAG: hypothetical protein A2289_16840 [Deltaproteobacteria bacterium RIFOXYA12_FULL_58_15]OGR10297.1 MAG: hypothetical protein A2341_16870 [Deltaproteobacteria bacterium RIFOXYB12_FULL_58_9]
MTWTPEPIPDDENTNVVVNRYKRHKRRMHLRVIIVVIPVALVLGYWMTTRKNCQDRFTVPFLGDAKEAATRKEPNWIVHPTSPTAQVDVRLVQLGVVWVDGEKLGKMQATRVDLKPGEHTIRAVFDKLELQQMMTVRAGQQFLLTFDSEKKDVLLDRVAAPK